MFVNRSRSWQGAVLAALVLLACAGTGARAETPAAATRLPEGWRPALVREATLAALTRNGEHLAEVRATAAGCEVRAEIARGTAQSVDPLLALLQACAEPMPERRDALLRTVRGASAQPEVAQQVRRALAEEPAARIERLRRQDLYNRSTVVVNFVANLATNILTANFLALTERMADLFTIGESATALTPRDRLELDIYARWRQEVERPAEATEPAEEQAARAQSRQALATEAPRAERLARRHAERAVLESAAWGRWYLAHGLPEEAYAAFGDALDRDPSNAQARQGRLEAAQVRSADLRERIAALEAAPRTPTPPAEILAWTRMEAADGERHADVRHYVWTGDLPEADGPTVFTTRDRVHRVLSSIGILAPVGWVVRSVKCSLGKPVPDDEWRAAALRYLSEAAPSSDPASEWNRTARRLAESYEEGLDFDSARLWHDRARGEPDPAYAARLDEKAAAALRAAAMDTKDPEKKRPLLKRAVDRYGHTKPGAKAAKDLAQLDRDVAAGKYKKREEQLAREREEARAGGGEKGPLLPVALQADIGGSGFDVYPQLLPLPFDPEKLPLYR